MDKLLNFIKMLLALMQLSPEQRAAAEAQAKIKEATAWADSDEAKGLAGRDLEQKRQIEQLRKDCDALADQSRKTGRNALMTQPIVLSGFGIGGDRFRMRFSQPGMARDFAHFCRDIFKQRRGDVVKDLNANTDSEGGYTIPENMASEIERMVETVGVAMQIGGPVPLPAGVLKMNRSLAGATVTWKAPGAEGVKSTPTFGQLEMAAETLIAFIDSDLEFDEDTTVQVGNYLATEFAYALAEEEDRVAWSGTGIATDGGITGILNSDRVTVVTMANTKDAFEDIAFDDLVDLESAVWDGALANAGFLMHRTIKALIKKIKDTTGGGTMAWQPAGGSEPAEIIGYPHRVSGKMPATAVSAAATKFMAFGDFNRGLKIGRRGGIRIDFSPIPGWRTLQNCWRAFERIDMVVNGFTTAEIAATPRLANPIAVLKTHA